MTLPRRLRPSAAALASCLPALTCLLAPALGKDLRAQEATTTAAAETGEHAASKTPPADKQPIQLVRPTGVYADLAEQGGDLTSILMGGGQPPKPFYELIDKLDALAASESDKVLFDLTRPFGLNLAQMAEVGRSIQKVRKAGKTCYAYVENAGSTQYQIAAMCDKVMMAELGVIDLPAPALSVTFMKDALDLLGVQMDVVRCGDFKGAVEPYMLSSMSKHLRAHYEAMLEKINADIALRIAKGRDLSVTKVRAMQATRLFTAEAAVEAGLVDLLVPWKGAKNALALALRSEDFELHDAIGKKARKSINVMQVLSQMFNPKREEDVEADTVVVLHLSGEIVDGAKPVPGSMVSGPAVEEIQKLQKNDNVKGVVVRINSPGGSATASEAILLALRDLSAEKPVVVSMGRVAASGGYYITCIGRPIFAENGTITGSIGVFGMKPNVGPLMRRIGIHEELVALDASAAMDSIDRNWTSEQKQQVQGFVDKIYDVFVGHVSRSRGMTASEVLAIAGGRVWSGEQAVENGLVDEIGGLEDALAVVKKDAGVGADCEITHLPRPKDFFETVFAEMLNAEVLLPDARTRVLARRVNLDRALRVLLDALLNEQPTTVWALMPEAIDIR